MSTLTDLRRTCNAALWLGALVAHASRLATAQVGRPCGKFTPRYGPAFEGLPWDEQMPYRYDLFLSYPRRPLVQKWLNTFVPLFEGWLHEELLKHRFPLGTGSVRIFRDDQQIEVGQDWPDELRVAARDSRCVLAILLPSYFASIYCRWEWETFQTRGKGLIVPVRYHDCFDFHFREGIFDLSTFTATLEGAGNWPQFHDQVKVLASQTANRIIAAPLYPDDPEAGTWMVRSIPDPPPVGPIPQARL